MARTHEAYVALVKGNQEPESFDEDCQRPYSDRPLVLVIADESDSLAAVLAEATARFEGSHPGDYTDAGRSIDFYRGDPLEAVIPTIPTTKTVTITSPDGLAIWHVAPEDASIGDLVLARERKVFPGDPLRPYLFVDPHWGMGGQVPGGWDTFIQIWDLLVYAVGSWEVLKKMVRVSHTGRELLDRAANRWQRHRKAAVYTRELFERRGADIMDVIETAQAAATYQIADLMAWTGIEDSEVAVDVAGWAGYELDESSQSLSKTPDERFVDLVTNLPINVSIDPLDPKDEDAHHEVTTALAEFLIDRGLADEM